MPKALRRPEAEEAATMSRSASCSSAHSHKSALASPPCTCLPKALCPADSLADSACQLPHKPSLPACPSSADLAPPPGRAAPPETGKLKRKAKGHAAAQLASKQGWLLHNKGLMSARSTADVLWLALCCLR